MTPSVLIAHVMLSARTNRRGPREIAEQLGAWRLRSLLFSARGSRRKAESVARSSATSRSSRLQRWGPRLRPSLGGTR